LGVQRRIHFVGQFAQPEVVYSGFDVFVSPSRFEGTPFTLLEAMASGLVCVATDVGAAPDALGREEAGIVVAANSAEALSAGLLRAVRLSAEERMRLGNRARQVVIERLSDRESFGTYCDWLEGREPETRS
jgi:glycosyltransferase involved in cell wall biosynthesis